MFRSFLAPIFGSVVLTPFVLFSFGVVAAQMMGSESFLMESDSVNIGGGFAGSDNFLMESTMGELATGESGSDNFQLRAGFQQMQSVQLSMTIPDPVIMSPSIPGVAGGIANGSTTVTVITDSPGGYQIEIAALNNPALQENGGPATIADYSPTGASDYTFVVGDFDSHMGYTVVGDHVDVRFLNNTSVCSAGTANTGQHCWDGLSTTAAVIVSAAQSNHPVGSDTTVYFRVGVGGSVLQAPGVYTATTTLTATPL